MPLAASQSPPRAACTPSEMLLARRNIPTDGAPPSPVALVAAGSWVMASVATGFWCLGGPSICKPLPTAKWSRSFAQAPAYRQTIEAQEGIPKVLTCAPVAFHPVAGEVVLMHQRGLGDAHGRPRAQGGVAQAHGAKQAVGTAPPRKGGS